MNNSDEDIGIEKNDRPVVVLIGKSGNVFSIIGEISEVLMKHGFKAKSDEFCQNALQSDDYNSVIKLALKYIKIDGLSEDITFDE